MHLAEMPKPTRSKPGDVLVENYATSVNPVDFKLRAGLVPFAKLPKVPGGDVAGVVVEADPGSQWKPGARVYALTEGFTPFTANGTYAQFVVVPESQLAPAPTSIPLQQAAALPLVCLTAMQALDSAGVTSGQRVLIHAGSGGVGSHAVQLAKARGLHVTSTCSTANVDFVRSLGADEVVDYHQQKFDEVCKDRPFDAIIDAVGGRDYESRGYRVLKKSGTYIAIPGGKINLYLAWTVLSKKLMAVIRMGPRYKFFLVKPNGKQLAELATLVDAGKVRPVIDRVLPLEQAVAAHEYLEKGHAKGKVVLAIKDTAVASQ